MTGIFDSMPSVFGDPDKAITRNTKGFGIDLKTTFGPVTKHQKKQLIACDVPKCFHPAHQKMDMGNKTMNVCDCHYLPDPHPCNETKAKEERQHHIKDGECIFCKKDRAPHAIFGLSDKVTFVCDKCYHTPLNELNRFYKH